MHQSLELVHHDLKPVYLYLYLIILHIVSIGTILISEHKLMLPSHFSSKMLCFTLISKSTLNFLSVFLSVNNHVIFSIFPELRIFPISFCH